MVAPGPGPDAEVAQEGLADDRVLVVPEHVLQVLAPRDDLARLACPTAARPARRRSGAASPAFRAAWARSVGVRDRRRRRPDRSPPSRFSTFLFARFTIAARPPSPGRSGGGGERDVGTPAVQRTDQGVEAVRCPGPTRSRPSRPCGERRAHAAGPSCTGTDDQLARQRRHRVLQPLAPRCRDRGRRRAGLPTRPARPPGDRPRATSNRSPKTRSVLRSRRTATRVGWIDRLTQPELSRETR